jgi:hypothetical protein
VDRERAGVDVADRVDQAHHPSRPAQVQARQRVAERREVEERVAGQDLLATGRQPLVELALLARRRVQLVPDVRAAARRPQPRDPQLRAVRVRDRLERVELTDVLARHHDRELEVAHPRRVQVAHRRDRGVVGARPTHAVVDLRGRAVE